MFPIFLTGLSGAGKSSIGPLLADRLGLPFQDLDALIEANAGLSVSAIFQTEGEAGFRAREHDALARVARGPLAVVALGGGSLLAEANRHLVKDAEVIWLEVSVETAAGRLAGKTDRPLLRSASSSSTLADLLAERQYGYHTAATSRVTTDGLEPGNVADTLAAGLLTPRDLACRFDGYEYPVRIVTNGLDAIRDLVSRLNVRHAAIISDENVAPLYASRLTEALSGLSLKRSLHSFPAGEAAKSLSTVEGLMRGLRGAEVDRGGCIVALGGGVVGDVAGFVAATYLRGLPVVQVPTTLLAQVDSSVGGKTGVNLDAEKNLIGAFHPPVSVLASMSTLDTLPEAVYLAGFAELLKHGVLADPALTSALTRNPHAIAARVPLALARWVRASVAVKRDIVESDPREKGRRKVLNFGHTFGHAFESASHFELSHGHAVALGMLVATWLGERLGETDAGTYDTLHAALTAIGLPTDWQHRLSDRVLQHLLADKKRAGSDLAFVFARRIGEVDISHVPLNTIQDLAMAARSTGSP